MLSFIKRSIIFGWECYYRFKNIDNVHSYLFILVFIDRIQKLIQYKTAQKMKFSSTDLFGKCDQIRSFLRIWSHLLKKPLMQNFLFGAVQVTVA